jgi:UDP-N-acetylmuramoyl-tripeptide--D-alanyl-D-alanine ligase
MLEFTVGQIVSAVGGRLLQGDLHEVVRGLATDSRRAQPGELFVALGGEQFDGRQFIPAAAQAGAVAAIAAAPVTAPAGMALVVVDDSLAALGAIGRAHRRRFDIPVIGITGSNGKTTTKDLLAAILEQVFPVIKTEQNFNNEIGLPLTLARINVTTRAAVVEMGMRGLGQINQLAQIALPTMGIVTNVGLTHLELLGTQANIAQAKGELVAALEPTGLAVLNGDDPYVRAMRSLTKAKTVLYGIESPSLDYRATAIRLRDSSCEFIAQTPDGSLAIDLPLPGRHNILNALAAIAVAKELGVDAPAVRAGLTAPTLTGKRLHTIEHNQRRIIDDTYNASPTSVRAALEVLTAGEPGKNRRIAVLADMLELGSEAARLHRELGEYAAQVGVDWLLGYGELAREYVTGFNAVRPHAGTCYQTKEALLVALQNGWRPGDRVLVKGSRGMKMEEIVTALTQKEEK